MAERRRALEEAKSCACGNMPAATESAPTQQPPRAGQLVCPPLVDAGQLLQAGLISAAARPVLTPTAVAA